MKIDEIGIGYETVNIEHVGIVDPLTGGIFFKDETVEFLMTGFYLKLLDLFLIFLERKHEKPSSTY